MGNAVVPVLALLVFGMHGVGEAQDLRISRYEGPVADHLRIQSELLGEEREYFIGLPTDYDESAAHPLIVMLEGEVLFDTFAAMTRLMADAGEIPPSIVVGIPVNGRELDYAPRIEGYPESGRADLMLEHFRTELFPVLDSLYNLTDDRVIWGHSALGGLFCTYLLLGPDRQFTGILSSSPNLRFTRQYIEGEDPFADLARKGQIFYYLTFGGSEAPAYMGEMFEGVRDFADKLDREAPGNLIWEYRLYQDNNHFTNAVETYIDGLKLYFQSMR